MYQFKAAYKSDDKRGKGAWKYILLSDNKTLWDLDKSLRTAFDHDQDDHLSEFKVFGYIFQIEPHIETKAATIKMKDFPLKVGKRMDWIYDLGDCLEHVIVFLGYIKGEV